MKAIKYQQEVIKRVLKGKNNEMIRYWEQDGFIYSCIDSFRMIRIPKSEWVLDLNNIDSRYNQKLNLDEFIGAENDYEDAILTNEIEQETTVTGKKSSVRKIVSANNPDHYIWFNEKFLEYYDEPTFKLAKDFKVTLPIRVYERGVFTGFICGLRRR